VDERAMKLSESVLEEADRNGVLRWKEELDAKHLLSSLTDGCVCGLCKAARTALAESPSEPPAVLTSELESLKAMPDAAIDTSDIPEVTDWSNAERGKFYRQPAPKRDTRTGEELQQRARELWRSLPHCCGYPECDGDLVATPHSQKCPLFGRVELSVTEFGAYCIGETLRAGEPQRGKEQG
jgi:hypothetical protein